MNKVYRITFTEYRGKTSYVKKFFAKDLNASEAENFVFLQSLIIV